MLLLCPLYKVDFTLLSGVLTLCGRRVLPCECFGDRINRVQDLQGVPGSQDCYYGRPYFWGHWREYTSACHIHNNWIWVGFVFNPIALALGYHYEHGGCLLCPHPWYPYNTQCDYDDQSLLCYFTDNMSLFRVLHLPLSWCGCQWDCLSTTRVRWWKLVLGVCLTLQKMELSMLRRGDMDDPEIHLSDDLDIQMVDRWIVTKAIDSTITILEELASSNTILRWPWSLL